MTTPLSITGQSTELGRLLARRKRGGHGNGNGNGDKKADKRTPVHINVAGQQANSLLHDGHAWKDFARLATAGARRALRSDARVLVHASFAFVAAEPPRDPLRSLAQVIVELEQQVLAGPLPAVVVRLGYLYGPTSRDLRAYRTAFRLGRPYWAGARHAGQYHLHHDDAVAALLAAARVGHAGRTFHATAGPALPFMRFMDHFARAVGTRFPLHVPKVAAPLMRLIVCKEHMQQAVLVMPDELPLPQVPRWQPQVLDHLAALDEIVASWRR